MSRFAYAALPALLLAACSGGDAPEEETEAPAAAPAEAPMEDAAPAEDAAAPEAGGPAADTLDYAVAGAWRSEDAARDEWRNPAETLRFFEIDPSSTIIEIWPGGGWYAQILAPWTAANGGTYVAAHFDPEVSERRARSRSNFEANFSAERYGDVTMSTFSEASGDLVEPGTADAVLSFRNVHNWMGGGWAEKAFADFYVALRPGGVLGIVEHRLPSTREQDPRAGSGYVQEGYVIRMAEEAGFEFIGSSEVNANPADTADHPFGVWTLRPMRRSERSGMETPADFDREALDAIGESDRMTLLFRKPVEDVAEDGGEE